jgi:hypothetical protein
MDEDNWLDKPYFCTYWNRTDGVRKKMAEIEQIDCGRGRENNEIQRVETEPNKIVPVSKSGQSESDNIKKSDPVNQGNSSSASHKIHELQEKGKSNSRSASPATTKSDKPISLPLSVGDKMRDSSSLDKKILNFQKHPILFRLAFKKFLFEKKKEIPSNFFNFAI